MPSTNFFTKKLNLPFQAGGKTVDRLPRDGVIRHLSLRLTGQLTLTAANNLRSNFLLGDEWNCIQRIDIIANNNTIRSIPGAALWNINQFYYGTRPKMNTQFGDSLFNGAGTGTANPGFDSVLNIPFWMPRSVKPIQMALPAHLLNDLRIEITWGTFTSINSAATAFTTAPSLEITSYYSTPILGQFQMTRVYPIQQQVPAATLRQRINIPTGPMYRGFLIQCLDSTGVKEMSSNAGPWENEDNQTVTSLANNQGVNNIKLVSGDLNFMDQAESVAYQDSRLYLSVPFNQTYGNARGAAVATGLQTNIATSNQSFSNVPTRVSIQADERAWTFIDLVRDGYNTECIDTYGWTEFFLELDVRGVQLINVFPLEINPVRASA